MVSFSALLGRPRADELGDADPVERTLGVHELREVGVFGLGPGPTSMGRHAGRGSPSQSVLQRIPLVGSEVLSECEHVKSVE